jgi:hypothetical protein
MNKKIIITSILSAYILLLSTGCAEKKPDIALKEALAKSHTATSYNTKGEFKIDRLLIKTLPEPSKKYNPQEMVDFIRASSISHESAIDETIAKVESVCTFKTKYDGIDMSIRIPILMDFRNETLYISNSFMISVLSLATKYDKNMKPKDKQEIGRVKEIFAKYENTKINLSANSELFKELDTKKYAKTKKDKENLKKIQDNLKLNEEFFKKYITLGKKAETQILADINATAFSYSKTKIATSEKTVQISLDNNQTAKLAESIINVAIDMILQDEKLNSEINKQDRAKITPIISLIFETINANTIMKIGLNKDGYIDQFNTNLEISDKKNELGNISLLNEVSYSNFNNAKFTIDTANSIEIVELLKQIKQLEQQKKTTKRR